MASKYQRTNKAVNHSREAVDIVSELVGRRLPQPSYSSDLSESGQGIYDTLSHGPKDAVTTLPDSVFKDADGIEYSERFAEAIRLVHDRNPAIWSLLSSVPEQHFTALNVQDVNVISLSDRFRFLVRRELVDAAQLSSDLQSLVSYEGYTKFPDLVQVEVDRTTPESSLEELWRVHRILLESLASANWIKNAQFKKHRDDLRTWLSERSDPAVPAPSYVPDERLGLANWSRVDQEEPSISSATVLGQGFASAGLTYTQSQIASFYTSLQTKGFVILSGISGTGKSKIAQRFAAMLFIAQKQARERVDVEFVRPVEPYMKKYNLFVIPKELSGRYMAPEPGAGYSIRLEIDGLPGAGRLQNPKNLKTGEGWSVRLSWKGPLREQFSSMDTESIRVRMRLTQDGRVEHVEITPELDDAGASNEIETVGIRDTCPSNHLFLPVRPDWRDGKALIGYHNPLTGEYVRTDFLDFVITAGDDFRAGNRNAFFVILDEMNLAHVEYYFADVLSVIESGRDEEGWTVEGIPLAVGEEDADLPAVLKLPPNLYIVGTVNMDETTYPFSPKVLDRAFTIELTEVDFSNYPPEPVEGNVALSDDERVALLDGFIAGGERYPRIDKGDIRAAVASHGQFRTDLDNLNTSLKRYRMHFGYRVFDEIMQFVHNAELNGLFSPEEAFDHAVLMKVLPKFNGSRAKLERPLVELILWSRQRVQATEDDARAIVADLENYLSAGKSLDSLVVDSDDWRYPATGKRAALMMQDLYTDGFASFG